MDKITNLPGVTILPFKQATAYTKNAIVEVRAIAWHFAEGGGTDTWLTRADGAAGNNSCHVVIKYDGSIRQIVDFTDASHSLHLSTGPRQTEDYDIFSFKNVEKALGAGASDPNRYIIAVEIEGYRKTGPNITQIRTIQYLAQYFEDKYSKAVHLGHGDFQDKPCPGKILFETLPHTSRFDSEEDVAGLKTTLPNGEFVVGKVLIPKGYRAIPLHDKDGAYIVPITVTRPAIQANLSGGLSGAGYLVDLNGDETHFIREGSGVIWTPPSTQPIDQQIATAVTNAVTPLNTEIQNLRTQLLVVKQEVKAKAIAFIQTL